MVIHHAAMPHGKARQDFLVVPAAGFTYAARADSRSEKYCSGWERFISSSRMI